MKHKPVATESGWMCETCKRTWKQEPNWLEVIDCLGMPVYSWGQWPEHLLTKKQLDEAGLQTGKKLPPPAGLVYRKKSPGGKMYLYDKNQGVPKHAMTEQQLAALAKAQEMSKPVDIHCPRCHESICTVTTKRAAEMKPRLCQTCKDHFRAAKQALAWLAEPLLVLDFETTGLDTDDQIIQAGVINQDGDVLIDTLIKPTIPIPASATRIHHITDEMVASAPSFAEVYPRLAEVLEGQIVVIYNAEFDVSFLYHDCRRNSLKSIEFTSRCAMRLYAKFVGEWSNRYMDYRFQSLPYGDHSALGDCLGTLRLLKEIAAEAEEKGEETANAN